MISSLQISMKSFFKIKCRLSEKPCVSNRWQTALDGPHRSCVEDGCWTLGTKSALTKLCHQHRGHSLKTGHEKWVLKSPYSHQMHDSIWGRSGETKHGTKIGSPCWLTLFEHDLLNNLYLIYGPHLFPLKSVKPSLPECQNIWIKTLQTEEAKESVIPLRSQAILVGDTGCQIDTIYDHQEDNPWACLWGSF